MHMHLEFLMLGSVGFFFSTSSVVNVFTCSSQNLIIWEKKRRRSMQLRQRETSVCWAANRVCVHDLVISGEWDLAERDSGGRARVRTCGQRHGPDSAASSMQSKSGGGPAVPRRSSSSDPSELALFYLRPLLRSRTTPPPGASSQEDTHAPRSTTPAACWELIDDPCVHGHLAAASSDPYFWASGHGDSIINTDQPPYPTYWL
jgi:hypothetical protein